MTNETRIMTKLRAISPQEKIDNLLSVILKLDEQITNMKKAMTGIVNGLYDPEALSVCDNCEEEMPLFWLDKTEGICVFCGKMHTEE